MLRILSCIFVIVPLVTGRPSFRFRIPNGDRVPCVNNAAACFDAEHSYQPARLCRAVGHPHCVPGLQPVNAFGQDLINNNYKWTRALCEADSDGDGQSNGVELGDPCCEWDFVDGIVHDGLLAWTPSHPGEADSGQDVISSEQREAQCALIRNHKHTSPNINKYYNPGEEQRNATFMIKNYSVHGGRGIDATGGNDVAAGAVGRTVYADFTWRFRDADCEANGCTIVGMEAIIKSKYVHHYVIKYCDNEDDLPPTNLSGIAYKETNVDPAISATQGVQAITSNCRGWEFLSAAWAPGADPMVSYPNTAGRRFGHGSVHLQGFDMQVHYDNPWLDNPAYDTSGFILFYTTAHRTDRVAGLSGIRLSYSPRQVIPMNTPRFFIANRCRISGLPAGGVQIVDAFYHAHLSGREMYLKVIRQHDRQRNGQASVRDMWNERTFDFDDQYRAVWLEYANEWVNNGDEIQHVCVYNTVGRSENVRIGEATPDEMCWGVINYLTTGVPTGSCDEGVTWTGTLGPNDDAAQLPAPPKERCGMPMTHVLFNIFPSPIMQTHGDSKCSTVPTRNTDPCCDVLRGWAADGCLCDANFLAGQGYASPQHMQALKEAAGSVCGLRTFEQHTCRDDIDGALGLFGDTDCASLLQFGCETDLSQFIGMLPPNSFVRIVCPFTCGVCQGPQGPVGEAPTCPATPPAVISTHGSNCVGWRATSDCDPAGQRAPANDKDCSTHIAGRWAGYCECLTSSGTVRAMQKGCHSVDGDGPLERALAMTHPSCKDVCQLHHDLTSPPTRAMEYPIQLPELRQAQGTSKKDNDGVIIGAIVGSIAFVLITVAVGFFYMKGRASNGSQALAKQADVLSPGVPNELHENQKKDAETPGDERHAS